MGKECSMLEVLKLPLKNEEGNEFELSLELSIGGNYGKSSKSFDKSGNHISRSDFSCGKNEFGAENGSVFVDMQKKREIQALKRQEIRKKRHDKLKKTRGNGPVEDKLVLEARQFQYRARDRENREKDGFPMDLARKNEKNSSNTEGNHLNLCLFGDNYKIPTSDRNYQRHPVFAAANGFPYPCVVPSWGLNVGGTEKNRENAFRSSACGSSGVLGNGNGTWVSSDDCDSGQSSGKIYENGNRVEVSGGSLERTSSAVSDFRSTSHKGGSSSDTSSLPSYQRRQSSLTSAAFKQPEHTDSPSQTERVHQSDGVIQKPCKVASSLSVGQLPSPSKSIERSKPDSHSDQTNSTYSTSDIITMTSSLSKEPSIEKPPKPPRSRDGASMPRMPYVSATGNGPDGRTVTGFLYKYTKSEVSIMCVCHGTSFSPAEFVEHAGGVDVSHPLKHITILPSALG